jgi:hypothetical protein
VQFLDNGVRDTPFCAGLLQVLIYLLAAHCLCRLVSPAQQQQPGPSIAALASADRVVQ